MKINLLKIRSLGLRLEKNEYLETEDYENL